MNILKRILLLLLAIPLVVGLSIVQISFVHYHHLTNGHIITHSHPYKKSNTTTPKHHHTSSELIILQIFNGSLSSDVNTIIISADVGIIFNNNFKPITPHYGSRSENNILLRGPPCLI